MYIFYHGLDYIRLHFNETCCEEYKVPEDCMGLCREKDQSRITRYLEESRILKELPIDQCVEHEDNIRKCLIEEGKRHICP